MQNISNKTSALARLNKNSISVKDISSQLWCEKQMELFITTGGYSTLAMNKGAAIHAVMQAPVFKALPIEPITYPDRLYKWAYETYMGISNIFKNEYCREIKIYGSLNGFKITGQVDELRLKDGKVSVVEDKTINASNSNVVSLRLDADKLQISIYKLLLDDIKSGNYTYENFANSYTIEKLLLSKQFADGLESIGIKKESQSITSIYKLMFESFKKLPEFSNIIKLRYLDRATNQLVSEIELTYSKEELKSRLIDIMEYWSGKRDAKPVSEENKWRCKICKFFGKECTTWWNK